MPQQSTGPQAIATTWEAIALPGKQLSLVDQSRIQDFSFKPDAMVVATFGTVGGAVVGPILFWSIQGKVLVISRGDEHPPIEALSDPSLEGSYVWATRATGERVKYTLVGK